MIIGNSTVWKYKDNKWMESNLNKLKRLSFKEAYVYNGYNQILENAYLNLTKDGLEIYSKNYENIEMNSNVLSVIGPKKVKVGNLEMMDTITEYDEQYINDVLNKYSIDISINNMLTYKNVIDINNDGNEDYLFNISNFYTEGEKDVAFSIIFCVINNNIKIVDKVIVDVNKELSEKAIYLTNIIDYNEDNIYEIIVNKTRYGDIRNDCHAMYKYVNGKYEKIIGC